MHDHLRNRTKRPASAPGRQDTAVASGFGVAIHVQRAGISGHIIAVHYHTFFVQTLEPYLAF